MKNAEVMRQVRDEARRRGVRWTNQRQVILDTFICSDEHLTVEELHRRVKAIDRTVSAATVYRTINMLVDIGVANKSQFGGGSASFEMGVDKQHHDHLVCTVCGTIVEFHDERIEQLQEGIARQQGFSLLRHRMELYGVCPACQKKAQGGAPASA
jgi:Fur family ferric uptake transcriptional regulator